MTLIASTTAHRKTLYLSAFILLVACGGGGGSSQAQTSPPPIIPPPAPTPTPSTFSELVAADAALYSGLETRTLDADGEGTGLTAYELVRNLAGSNPIESPDLYSINHPGDPHIYEALDPDIGEHFVFVMHRDLDRDRGREDITDRQRNEIKTYGGSETALKGYENETMTFSWKFQINSEMAVSTRFSHFFQLKAVGGIDSHPIVTFTGNEQSSEDGMEVRHSPLQIDTDLARVDWSEFTGEWVEAYVRTTFADSGSLRIIVARMRDGEILFDIDETDIDMWRGDSADDFVRPKWGIYRSLDDKDNLRPEEEIVRFANFVISKVEMINN